MDAVSWTLPPMLAPDTLATLTARWPAAPTVLVLRGDPGTFCEGLDLGWVLRASTDAVIAFLERFSELLTTLAAWPAPIVALVDGVASGGGLAIAAAADLVVATRRASFQLPEVFAGLIPAVALPWVRRRVGPTRARLLAMGGPPLDAAAALGAGLCDELADDLDGAAARHLARWRRADPGALARARALGDPAPSPAQVAAALTSVRALLDAEGTRPRLARLVDGDAPWEDA